MDLSYPPDLPEEEKHGDPSEQPKSADKSEALFSMYLDRSDEDDRRTTERWKGECDAILIFTGLFSAALAALLSISTQGLQQNPQDTSAFYLRNIYHLLANTTSSQPPIYLTPSDPPNFSPPKSVVLVNLLWFLSLVMSLTGALLAVFIQQWAQSYLEATQGRYSPHDRARIRIFHAEGLEKLYLHRVTRAVPILIHVSLFLFFSGLPIFLFSVNRTIFNVVVTWLGLCAAGYACITIMPIFCQNSPYYSPLSSSIWWCVTNTLFIIYQLLKKFISRDSSVFRWYHTYYARPHLPWPSLRAMQKAAGRFALQLPSDIDYRALSWMFKTLNDDEEFEQFFDALPSLCESEELVDAHTAFIDPNEKKLSHALIGMMDRTLLSELVPEAVKQRRIIICTKAIGATSLLGPWWTLRRVLFGDWHGFSRSIHFGLFVQDWKNISHPVTSFYAQYVVAVTLASVQQRDDYWFQLASGQLNESKSLLSDCFARDDSILLANAILIIRRTIQTFSGSGSETRHRSDILKASSKTLTLVCRFDIRNTLPEHQHQFCRLWNQLVEATQNNTHPHVTPLCIMMLKSIRRLYITLHKKTSSSPRAFSTTTADGDRVLDDASSYPRCIIDGHRHSTPVPELHLDGQPRNALHNVIASSIAMIPALSPAAILSPAFITPNPTRFPTIVSGSYYSVAPGPYPVPRSSSHLAAPDLQGLSPFIPIPQMSSGFTHRIRDVPATAAEADSRQDLRVFHAPFPFIPEGRKVDASPSTISRSSSQAFPFHPDQVPALQGLPVVPPDTSLLMSAPAPSTSTPVNPPTVVVSETPPTQPTPVPTSATGSAMAIVLSPSQERTPSGFLSVPQGPTVIPLGTSLPTQVSPDSVSKHSIGAIPGEHLGVPVSPTPMLTAPSVSSRPSHLPTPTTGGGTMSVPSSAVRRGGPALTPLILPPVIGLNGNGEFSGLLYYSPHSVLYEDKQYPTALHLFEARKFLPHWPDIADLVRQCERVEQVPSVCAEMTNLIRPDWGNVMLSVMDDVLYLKFCQHDDLRTVLLHTYPAELIYVEPHDPLWGGDGAGAGMNELGKSLMRVREQLRSEGGI
ncbi:hypothetical protein DFH94DRAFT_858154 [Russula ochroleuca]|uniref:NADAR domain-containing protein n=1 Tax=Russula ochroleuca TaxID=152965 RepID=A0A9P5JT99_9AGAM|nr:hypothetical protein DFH94DRAFT_858154 [Russula ochroleuca]